MRIGFKIYLNGTKRPQVKRMSKDTGKENFLSIGTQSFHPGYQCREQDYSDTPE